MLDNLVSLSAFGDFSLCSRGDFTDFSLSLRTFTLFIEFNSEITSGSGADSVKAESRFFFEDGVFVPGRVDVLSRGEVTCIVGGVVGVVAKLANKFAFELTMRCAAVPSGLLDTEFISIRFVLSFSAMLIIVICLQPRHDKCSNFGTYRPINFIVSSVILHSSKIKCVKLPQTLKMFWNLAKENKISKIILFNYFCVPSSFDSKFLNMPVKFNFLIDSNRSLKALLISVKNTPISTRPNNS